uniref:Genome polyprotein n=1 Tax=Perinereis wilsoni picorna-like virus 2 TaxID=3237984 RepID=A0AB39A394_9PICO
MFKRRTQSKTDLVSEMNQEPIRRQPDNISRISNISDKPSQQGSVILHELTPVRDVEPNSVQKTFPVNVEVHDSTSFIVSIRTPKHTYVGRAIYRIESFSIDGNLVIIGRPWNLAQALTNEAVYVEYTDMAIGSMSIGGEGFVIRAKLVGKHSQIDRSNLLCRVVFDQERSLISIVQWNPAKDDYTAHSNGAQAIGYNVVDVYGRDVHNSTSGIAIPGDVMREAQRTGKPIVVLSGEDRQLPEELDSLQPREGDFSHLSENRRKNAQELFTTGHILNVDGNDIFLDASGHDTDSGVVMAKAEEIEYAIDHFLMLVKMAKRFGASQGSKPVLELLHKTRQSSWFKALRKGQGAYFINYCMDPARTFRLCGIINVLFNESFPLGAQPDELYQAHHAPANAIYETVYNGILAIIERTKDLASITYESLRTILFRACAYGSELFSALNESIGNTIDRSLTHLFSRMIAVLNPFSEYLVPSTIAVCGTAFVFVAAVTLGFMSVQTIFKVLDWCAASYTTSTAPTNCGRESLSFPRWCQASMSDDFYQAHGSDAVDGTAGLAALLFSKTIAPLTCKRQSEHVKILKEYIALFAAGAVAVKAVKGIAEMLWIILPLNMQTYLTMHFGSKAAHDKLAYENWRDRAITLARNQIPRVMMSALYRQMLGETVSEYNRTFEVPSEHRQFGVILFMQLVNKLAQLERFEAGVARRRAPYSLHICGKPGAGKSLLTPRIVSDVFGYSSADIYTKSNEEFWSGYIDQRVVFWDEFLAIADEQTLTRNAGEYLDLISNSDFMPQFADINPNPTTGQKGTKVHPEVVITANNEVHNRPPKCRVEAFQRRRYHVIYIEPREDCPMCDDGNNVNISEVPKEVRDKLGHLQFKLLPGSHPAMQKAGGFSAFPFLTYTELIDELKASYANFEQTRLINEQMTLTDEETNNHADPSQLFFEALARTKGIPLTENDVILGAFSNVPTVRFDSGPKRHRAQSPTMDDGYESHAYSTTTTMAEIHSFDEMMEELPANERMQVFTESVKTIPPGVMANQPTLYTRVEEYLSIACNTGSSIVSRMVGTEPYWKNFAYMTAAAVIGWTAIFGGLYLIRTIRNYFRSSEMDMEFHSDYTRKQQSPKRARQRKEINNSYSYHSRPEPDRREVLEFSFEYVDPETNRIHTTAGYGVPIEGKHFITNLHHFYSNSHNDHSEWFPTPATGKIIFKNKAFPVELESFNGSHDFNTDLIVIELKGKQAPTFPNNWSKFLHEDDITPAIQSQIGRLVLPGHSIYHGRFSILLSGENPAYSVPWNDGGRAGIIRPDAIYRLDVPSKKGDCGAPLIGAVGPYADKIMGLLCAGQENRGLSGGSLCTILSKEHIFEMLDAGMDDAPERFNFHGQFADEVTDWYSRRLGDNSQQKMTQHANKVLTGGGSECITAKRLEADPELSTSLVELMLTLTASRLLADKNRQLLSDEAYRKVKEGLYLREIEAVFDDKSKFEALLKSADVGQIPFNTNTKATTDSDFILRTCNEERKQLSSASGNYASHGAPREGPNMEWIDVVPKNERVHLNRKTSIKRSALAEYLPEFLQSKKLPAVMEPQERDGRMIDPIDIKIDTMAKVSFPEAIDEKLLKRVSGDVEEHYLRLVADSDVPKRVLTLEESVGGIDAVMKGMCLSTSPGYPLCVRHCGGKKKWVYRTGKNNDVVITDEFRYMVEELENRILNGLPVDEHRWQAHMKDETVSQEKIDNLRTRTIYCGDMVRQSIYRKYMGALLAAINNNPLGHTPSCISLNQYSLDMDKIYEHLVGLVPFDQRDGLKFQAGDYKNFDMCHHPVFTKYAYEIIRKINPVNVPETIWEDFLKSESQSPVAFGHLMVKFKSFHPSGCLFTTIKNNIQNELYFRYIYALDHPDRTFDDDIRMVALGDDHILCMREDVDFTGPRIAELMKLIGQTYTSDKKGAEIEDYQSWDAIHFLGAQPTFMPEFGRWVGAPKTSTIADMLTFTGDNDATLIDKVEQALDLCSLWSRDTYNTLSLSLHSSVKKLQGKGLRLESWTTRRAKVARRVAGTDDAYYAYGCDYQAHSNGKTVRDLTTFHTDVQDDVRQPRHVTREGRALAEESMSMEYTLESHIYRGSFEWTTDQAGGTIIGQLLAPFQILAAGSQANIQNMSFDRFIYWHGDCSLMLQINGTPFLQGALVLFWYPLGVCPDTYEREQWFALPHVVLNPHSATTSQLTVPFQYPRAVLNTFSGIDQSNPAENLGSFVVGVLSPLTATASDSVTVTIYSAFPDSKLTIPRPTTSATLLRKEINNADGPREQTNSERRSKADLGKINSVEWIAHGQGGSTMNTTNNYNITDVVGNVPIENTTVPSGNTQTISPDTDLVVPMDNPICASGAVPLVGQYPGMSRSNGLVPSQNLALHPQRYERLHRSIFDPNDMNIHKILAKPAYFEEFSWNATDAVGTVLLSTNLNSVLGKSTGDTIPFNLAFLNLCKFYRADITIDLWCIKTKFQTGRLRATVAYGAPPPIETADVNVYYNQTLDFVDNEKSSFVIPYNQATEFIRTWEGSDPNAISDPIQDYSLGTLAISVANQMRAASSVPQTVNVIMCVSFTNVVMAVPQQVLPFDASFDNDGTLEPFNNTQIATVDTQTLRENKPVAAVRAYQAHSDGPKTTALSEEPVLGEQTAEVGDGGSTPVAAVTLDERTQFRTTRPCRLQVGEKFEYTVDSLVEIMRRLHAIPSPLPLNPGNPAQNRWITIIPGVGSKAPISGGTLYTINNAPVDVMQLFYAAWGGSLRYRIYATSGIKELFYYPTLSKSQTKEYVFSNQLDWPSSTSQTTPFSGTNYVMTTGANTTTLKSTEFLFPTGDANYIDINVPFDTHFYYHLLDRGTAYKNLTGTITGLVNVVTDNDSAYVAQAFGDDFAYGVFRPPPALKLRALDVVGTQAGTPNNFNIGGFRISLLV